MPPKKTRKVAAPSTRKATAKTNDTGKVQKSRVAPRDKAQEQLKSTKAQHDEEEEKDAIAGAEQAKHATSTQSEQPPRSDEAFDALLEPFYAGRSLTDPINTARDKWNLLPAFLKVKGLVKQHIDSFNYLVEAELKKIVMANAEVHSEVDHKFYLKYVDIRVGAPNRLDEEDLQFHHSTITPNECRLRDMTYAAPIYVDFEYRRDTTRVKRKGVKIGRMPIMLRSSKCVLTGKSARELANMNECSIDPGGYFIVKGQEKVILVQEQLSKNRVIVESAKGILQASVTSSTHKRKSKAYVLLKKGYIYLRHPGFVDEIPIVIVLKALGMATDREVLYLVAGDDAAYQDDFAVNFELAARENVTTQPEALEYIGSKCSDKKRLVGGSHKRNNHFEAIDILSHTIIPHVPVKGMDFRPKALYIAHMTRRVLMAIQDPSLVDDRDYVGNKRLELAGQMLSLLFEDLWKRLNKEFRSNIDATLRKPHRTEGFDAFRHFSNCGHLITTGMERAISTGNWNLRRFRMERAGVTHVLSRLSYISALGMMTRITSQFEKTRKISGPRALQSSQFGMLCPSDTPEGESCGLVKNLALMTHITTSDDEEPVREAVFSLGAEDVTNSGGMEIYSGGNKMIFINGTPVAVTDDAETFVSSFRGMRRRGRFSTFVSIFINDHYDAIHIATDEGRICRPLIIVDRSKSRVTGRSLEKLRSGAFGFDDFLRHGLVEYLDVNEENDANIAMYERDINRKTTHLEIEPFTILGAVAGVIPYPHHNQSPRNTYQCAMGKQAIGTIAYNQFARLDSLLYLLVYPQKPLVKTRTIELIKYDQLPAGQNAIVAVMSYSGYDIEDALVLNKASCDRGFGRCQVFKKYGVALKKYANGLQDNWGEKNEGDPKHEKLGTSGIVEPGMRIEKDEFMVLKQTPTNTTSSYLHARVANSAEGQQAPPPRHVETQWRETGISYRLTDSAYIDKVMLTANEQDTTHLKIQTRQTRVPELGDKFSSRHGQKGVVGLISPQSDMPFSDEGIVPDVIMNPHGFPSRMTVGKMLELLAGKAGVLEGQLKHGTAFGDSADDDDMSRASGPPDPTATARVEDLADSLVRHGFSYSGKDTLTSGMSGTQLPSYIFTGPIYYQKLKHMVADKMHARSVGPRAQLTRQPTEGRSREGGLRLGEMERDCLIAYGASQLLVERLMLSSDRCEVDVCEDCGVMGWNGRCWSCGGRSADAANIEDGAGRPVGKRGVVHRVTMPYAAKLLVQELTSMNVRARLKLGDEFDG